MLRRQARERREYLYRKSLEGKERDEYEKRRAVREALREGKPLPTERLGDEAELRRKDEYADLVHDKPTTHEDDEYARAGEMDPKVGWRVHLRQVALRARQRAVPASARGSLGH